MILGAIVFDQYLSEIFLPDVKSNDEKLCITCFINRLTPAKA